MLLIALAVPLWLRRIPPNLLYGARFASTLESPTTWYAVNARAGRNLTLIGAAYLVLIGVLAVEPALQGAAPLLGVTILFLVALIANTVVMRSAARRLGGAGAHERSRGPAP